MLKHTITFVNTDMECDTITVGDIAGGFHYRL